MGFYNVQNGDVPYFKQPGRYVCDERQLPSVGERRHGRQPYHARPCRHDLVQRRQWKSCSPPHNVTVAARTANAGVVDEIENPNPASGTNNWYTEDGYGGGFLWRASYGGGSYTNCSDTTQPGVAQIVSYLKSLPTPINPRCQTDHYYLLNNYNPGYFGNGNNAYTDTNANNTVFTIPPSSVRSIGDELISANVSWKYYGDQWNNYVPDPYQLNYAAIGKNTDEYCNICNPFQYDTSIMASPTVRTAHIQDTENLYADIKNGNLPAVSIREAQRTGRRPPGVFEAGSL